MKAVLKQIPNLFTLGNLFFGCLAVISALKSDYEMAAIFVILGAVLDFFDGFLARLLNVQGELGKQLDSLADLISFGFTPAAVMISFVSDIQGEEPILPVYLSFFPLVLTLTSCYRLGKFNLDHRQSENFIGLPTPANALFWVFLPFLFMPEPNTFVLPLNITYSIGLLYILIAFFSYFMISELSFKSLKFSKKNKLETNLKMVFLIICLALAIWFKHLAITPIVLIYVLANVLSNFLRKKQTEN
ncbi:MAG: CDP-alcohol phosphatidyltransferase family protein [Luteibaculaceae bacterium]